MRAKGKFLEKTKYIIFILILLLKSNYVYSESIEDKIKNYNNSLKNSSAKFIQTDGETIEEGVIFFGYERIKIAYSKPNKITIVLSKKRGMYLNHNLEEVEYFNTNKSFVKFFFEILNENNFFDNSITSSTKDNVIINSNFEINEINYSIKIFYENNPIELRKIIVAESNGGFEIGFFGHINLEKFEGDFFSLANPYLIN